MAFATGFPPRTASGRKSIRFYATGTASANFDDNNASYVFIDGSGANPFSPLPIVDGSDEKATTDLTGGTHAGTPRGTGETFQDSAKALIWSTRIRVYNDGAGALEFSFDGVNVHGKVLANEALEYGDRYEAGIAIRGVSGSTPTYRIEAW